MRSSCPCRSSHESVGSPCSAFSAIFRSRDRSSSTSGCCSAIRRSASAFTQAAASATSSIFWSSATAFFSPTTPASISGSSASSAFPATGRKMPFAFVPTRSATFS